MKNLLRKYRRSALQSAFLVFVWTFSANIGPAHAQVATNSDGSLDLPYVWPTNVPPSGTFWLLSTLNQGAQGSFGPPLPFNPYGTNVNVYFYGTNYFGPSFVIDDSGIDHSDPDSSDLESVSLGSSP